LKNNISDRTISNTNLFYFLIGKRREYAKEDTKATVNNIEASPSAKRTKIKKSRETPTRSSVRLRK